MEGKTVAIMQPYFAPYIGYFQLISATDEFVFLDDVNFIKKGWINRNQILVNKNPALFTIPLVGASQNKKINELNIYDDNKWRTKLIRTIESSYSKAQYYAEVKEIINTILFSSYTNISELNIFAIKTIADYLNLPLTSHKASELEVSNQLKGEERIISICKSVNAQNYINAIGGQELYDKSHFLESNINLSFIESVSNEYSQNMREFHPNLSILDVMMFNSVESINSMLKNYTLK
jgi:hypothetical protein